MCLCEYPCLHIPYGICCLTRTALLYRDWFMKHALGYWPGTMVSFESFFSNPVKTSHCSFVDHRSIWDACIHLFFKYSLSIYYMLGTVWGGESVVNNANSLLSCSVCSHGRNRQLKNNFQIVINARKKIKQVYVMYWGGREWLNCVVKTGSQGRWFWAETWMTRRKETQRIGQQACQAGVTPHAKPLRWKWLSFMNA